MARRAALASDLAPLADRLKGTIGSRRIADHLLAAIARVAPDERLALAFSLRLAGEFPDDVRAVLADRTATTDLALCLGSSELIGTELISFGANWKVEFERARADSCESLVSSIKFNARGFRDRRDAAASLGLFKRRMFLRVAIADLLDRLSVMDTARAMSALADECIRAALEAARHILGDRARKMSKVCVLAMGKLGAEELNLSSDIDLVYLHESTADSAALEAAARVAEITTELLAAECFRVDMRLRPGGRAAPLVTTVDGAVGFYQALGQTWERAALLRARPVAGALEVGEELLSELAPFIYRRYLDFDTLRQLRAMKRQIEAELRDPAMVERNIKLGRGGIRELEFIVQALTLIYGGRDPRLRTRKTLDALERFDSFGYIPGDRARRLSDAYLFLRDVEHKLQAVAGLQTHALPSSPAAMRALAARLGVGKDYDAIARLLAQLNRHRDFVATQFRQTLAGGEEESAVRASHAAHDAWDAAMTPGQSEPLLAALGFDRPKESAHHLRALAREPEHVHASPRRRELIEQLGPSLLDEIRMLPDPDLALLNLSDFIAAVGARTSFLALLEQHPATRRILLRLFASSAYLSTIFIRHPDMLDTLVRSDIARPRRTADELAREVYELVAASTDFESKLDALRLFRHQEFLRIAIADLAGDLALSDVQQELTLLAAAVLNQSLALARAEVASRYEIPPSLRMCVIAMGRLGASEMSYNSDLDLIFVYDDRVDTVDASRVTASRIAQKLIAVLESRTREGYAYKLDLRLRPSGNAGPLVASLAGFREYHRESSAVWERQALVRARVVGGDVELGSEVETAREEFVFGRELSSREVREIHAMRMRMEREIGAEDKHRLNIKQGAGGLVDIEFMTQMLVLRHGHRDPALRLRSTAAMLAALESARVIEKGDTSVLREGYVFLSWLENRLRIDSDQPAWALPTDRDALRPLARRMGFETADGAAEMLAELTRRRTAIRSIFERYFAAEESPRS
jgi:[glutamine synthetase] adenylyltransferase / [glutamine synthetase]-adenylyl-L-tyrosine phosphorylase